MQLWGDVGDAVRDVTEYLPMVGRSHPEVTMGRSPRPTIRTVIQRMEGLIEHTYGEMELSSRSPAALLNESAQRATASSRRRDRDDGAGRRGRRAFPYGDANPP
ncbi:hypothetical protein C9J85_11685 [Haloferax sp. wsp5]|nr:hypothetical protein C9J85_11685 [Haloferax sp. wsp5]